MNPLRSLLVAAAAVFLVAARAGPAVVVDDSGRWASDGTRAALVAQLPAFFGHAPGDYFRGENEYGGVPTPDLLRQFELAFSGVPGPVVVFADGYRAVIGMVPHDALQLGVVVTAGDSNRIVATALLHHFCARPSGCQDEPVLTIFYAAPVAPQPALNDELVGWLRAMRAEQATHVAPAFVHVIGLDRLTVEQRVLDGR